MIEYKLKEELRSLIVCLYDSRSETPFTTDTLSNYIDACAWQLENGETPRRIVFHVTVSNVDATRAIDDMNRAIKALRKEERADKLKPDRWSRFKF
jgi:hypothetical protein